MDKRRLRVVLKVLEAVKTKYAEMKDLIEDECQKKKMSVEEVIFFASRSKELAQKDMFYFVVSMLRDILLS